MRKSNLDVRLLVDLSCIMHAEFYGLTKRLPSFSTSEFTAAVGEAISSYISRFNASEAVLAVDKGNYWRTDEFPEYKIRRRTKNQEKKKEEDPTYNKRTECFDTAIEDLKQTPWKVMEVDKCEADDIIGYLALNKSGDIQDIIIATDHDFLPLLMMDNTSIYNPSDKEMTKCDCPEEVLMEHIIQGCSGDDIPSIKPGVLGPTNARRLVKEGSESIQKELEDIKVKKAFKRNQRLIDFRYIPKHIQEDILKVYKSC